MKNLFCLALLALAMQGCFSKKAQVVTSQTTKSNEQQMYPGGTLLTLQDVPQPVLVSWNKTNSKVKGGQWYKTSDGFIVYYPYKKSISRTSYDATGKVIMQSREIKSEEVRPEIRDYMKIKYPGIQYGKTFLCIPSEGDQRYDVQVENKWESFDLQGKHIEKNSNIDENLK